MTDSPAEVIAGPRASAVIADYLRAIERRLPAPARARRALIDELHDGLIEAVAARRRCGLSAAVATREAIDEFGTPEAVAAAHCAELAVRQSRRGAWRVLVLVLAAGLAWRAYANHVGVPASVVPGSALPRSAFLLLTSTIKVVPVAIQVAAVVLIATSRVVSSDAAGRRRLLQLGWVVTVALLVSLANMAGIVLIGSDVLGSGPLISLVLTGAVVWALVESLRANYAVYRAEPGIASGAVPRTGGRA